MFRDLLEFTEKSQNPLGWDVLYPSCNSYFCNSRRW